MKNKNKKNNFDNKKYLSSFYIPQFIILDNSYDNNNASNKKNNSPKDVPLYDSPFVISKGDKYNEELEFTKASFNNTNVSAGYDSVIIKKTTSEPKIKVKENVNKEEFISTTNVIKPINRNDFFYKQPVIKPILNEDNEEILDNETIFSYTQVSTKPQNNDFVNTKSEVKENKQDNKKEELDNNQSEETSSLEYNEDVIYKKQSAYVLPSKSFFKRNSNVELKDTEWINSQIKIINNTMIEFGIDANVENYHKGPTVTKYEIALRSGIKVQEVSKIKDNLMMNLRVKSLRIEAPIPGKEFVGIETENKVRDIVKLGDLISDDEFNKNKNKLRVALGIDVENNNVYLDLASMPHGLIGGTTGAGKSVCIHAILCSLLLKYTPDELKFLLIDAKTELPVYEGLPHLVTPIIREAALASKCLNWICEEMERRNALFYKYAAKMIRDITKFNEYVTKEYINEEKLPYIVIIIDEFADLVQSSSGAEIEGYVQRIVQKARSAGIFLLIGTQRPSVDVIKGTIKANILVRLAFRVSSYVDSNTMLDQMGAEDLLGKGDMLLKDNDKLTRLQCALVDDDEVLDIVDFIKEQRSENYLFMHSELEDTYMNSKIDEDTLAQEIEELIVRERKTSHEFIKSRFNIGYSRWVKIMQILEDRGTISKQQSNTTKPRVPLITYEELLERRKNKGY
ncbi:MAG: DNA translocase FtsK [Acholeplasmatales bacterium]|nr:DNA translocase FtsK [Acholeplasmatales bacterium]